MFRVLVVAKNITTANLAAVAVKRLNFGAQINYALSATQAIFYLASLHKDPRRTLPDIILLSGSLPSGDGLDALEALVRAVGADGVPIVVMSKSLRPEERSEYVRRGATAVLASSESSDDLIEEMSDLICFVAMTRSLIPKQPRFLPDNGTRRPTAGEILQVHL